MPQVLNYEVHWNGHVVKSEVDIRRLIDENAAFRQRLQTVSDGLDLILSEAPSTESQFDQILRRLLDKVKDERLAQILEWARQSNLESKGTASHKDLMIFLHLMSALTGDDHGQFCCLGRHSCAGYTEGDLS